MKTKYIKNIVTAISLMLSISLLNAQDCTQCDNTTPPAGSYASELGVNTTANGMYSLAGGINSTAEGNLSFAFGQSALAQGGVSFALGASATASNSNSFALGTYCTASGSQSFVFGNGVNSSSILNNQVGYSLMIGFNSDKPTFFVGQSNGAGTTGRIGIGNITDPQAKLHIKGDENGGSSEDADILLEPGNSMKYARIKFGTTGNRIEARGSQDMNFHTASDFVFWDANVGIGTYNPSEKLDVTGTIKSTGLKLIDGNQSAGKILQSDANGNASWVDPASINDGDWNVNTYNGNVYRMNGNVGIGTNLSQNPNGYKLAVNGIIGAKEVYVENTSSTWPDYVFDGDYDLRSIKKLEEFINNNGHLPGVPTAEEVNLNGLKLAEMNALLLKKVEELTLYLINLKKDNETLQKRVGEIECKITKNR